MVDKIEAKKYVASVLGEGNTIPLLGVWKSPDEIDFNRLPNQFVLKCNHNSGGGMVICRDFKGGDMRHGKSNDPSHLTVAEVREGLRKALAVDYYKHCREWPYKNVNVAF